MADINRTQKDESCPRDDRSNIGREDKRQVGSQPGSGSGSSSRTSNPSRRTEVQNEDE